MMGRRAAALAARTWFHSQLCMSDGCDGTDHAVVHYRKMGRDAAACATLAALAVVVHAQLCHPHCVRAAQHALRAAELPPTLALWETIRP